MLLTTARFLGNEPAVPGLMSRNKPVPAAVPSLRQSSTPCARVVVSEEQRAVECRELGRCESVRAGIPRVDVGEHGRAGRGAVADPELGPGGGVTGRAGREEEPGSGNRRSSDRRADGPGPPAPVWAVRREPSRAWYPRMSHR